MSLNLNKWYSLGKCFILYFLNISNFLRNNWNTRMSNKIICFIKWNQLKCWIWIFPIVDFIHYYKLKIQNFAEFFHLRHLNCIQLLKGSWKLHEPFMKATWKLHENYNLLYKYSKSNIIITFITEHSFPALF